MKWHAVLAVAGASIVGTPTAWAQVYDFTFSGTGHAEYIRQCGGPFFPPCSFDFPFFGTVRVETARAGDGFFSGADMNAVTLTWSTGNPFLTFTATGLPPFSRLPLLWGNGNHTER
jgi:hypothetical protein